MKKTTLVDGSQIFCITPTEGQMLYEHISGYLEHDLINIAEGDKQSLVSLERTKGRKWVVHLHIVRTICIRTVNTSCKKG